ncbi:hypothetical protein N7528_010110 [Penicillium herquei]|nr:hypothetical protein N7528_010110 [Penicillium herquei]
MCTHKNVAAEAHVEPMTSTSPSRPGHHSVNCSLLRTHCLLRHLEFAIEEWSSLLTINAHSQQNPKLRNPTSAQQTPVAAPPKPAPVAGGHVREQPQKRRRKRLRNN